jgi:hypothetical protein
MLGLFVPFIILFSTICNCKPIPEESKFILREIENQIGADQYFENVFTNEEREERENIKETELENLQIKTYKHKIESIFIQLN